MPVLVIRKKATKAEIKERYLKETVPMRLGHLASDLARIASLLEMRVGPETVRTVIKEGLCFVEWTAGDVDEETRSALIEIQRSLLKIDKDLGFFAGQSQRKIEVREWLRATSGNLLQKAGFLNDNPAA
jgi:hypothetical protein